MYCSDWINDLKQSVSSLAHVLPAFIFRRQLLETKVLESMKAVWISMDFVSR